MSWLTMTEAASYLRTSEQVLRDELKKGRMPSTSFGGQLLFNTSQLDEFLIGPQKSQPDPGTEGKHSNETPEAPAEDFMSRACKLWDEGIEFVVKMRTRGASCQFEGKPRLWVYPEKFQVPARDKGNEVYAEIRTTLANYFPEITSKATVHIKSRFFSWKKFAEFVHAVKSVCKNESTPEEMSCSSEQAGLSIYEHCIACWEEPPKFTIVRRTRGCSARYADGAILWFFPGYIKIPTDAQGNSCFEDVRKIKEEVFPNMGTRTKVSVRESEVDRERAGVFIADVKRFCRGQ